MRLALDLIADKWSTLIITVPATSPLRFGNLRRGIGGSSAKVLAERVPPSVEYALLAHWGESHLREIDAAISRHERGIAS
jgi:hypothetical protein